MSNNVKGTESQMHLLLHMLSFMVRLFDLYNVASIEERYNKLIKRSL